ncbi:MAG: hypothetical protein LBT16_13385 [Treponema sp.]|jgi:hypothetical protein|nr:hypothetical protein [Treponema sp.]
MTELIVLELLAGIFLLLPLLRSLIKKLWGIDGLVWLPVLALGIIIAIFPVYGFRPECIPLLIYGIVFNIANISQIISLIAHLHNDDFREWRLGLTSFLIILLVCVLGIGLFFLPGDDTGLISQGVSSVTAYDGDRQEKFFLRIYGPAGESDGKTQRPILILAPPITLSISAVDQLSAALRDGGFTVISYSRENFDFPAIDQKGKFYWPSLPFLINLFRAGTQGRYSVAANTIGRSLESERGEDIRFLLDYIKRHRGIPGYAEERGENGWNCIFAAGYGAAGAALLSLAGDSDFVAQNPSLRGIIAVESPPLSILKGNDPVPGETPPRNANWFHFLRLGITGWVADIGNRKITGMGNIPGMGIPACFIVSDRIQLSKYQDDRYAGLLRVFHAAKGPAILAAISGAGILDYSDIPKKYPIYSFLSPGKDRNIQADTANVPGEDDSAPATALLMKNFIVSVLEGTDFPVRKGVYIETIGDWNLLKNKDILDQ